VSAPRLAAVHGWGMHADFFAPLAQRLAGRLEVQALDLPGHGRRRRGELLEDLDAVAADLLARAAGARLWLGWSLGGLVAAHIALRNPQLVDALVLVGTTPRFVAGVDWSDAMAPEVFERFAGDLESDYRDTLDRFVALEVHGSDTGRRDLPVVREVLHLHPPPERRTLRSALALLRDVDLREEIGGLEGPTLVIGGTRDRLVPPAAIEAFAAALPRGRGILMRGSGHAPFIGHPRRFDSHLVSFLEDVNRHDATA